MNGKINVIVLAGGPSSEHDVSLKTASVIARHLQTDKYNVKIIKITKEGKWLPPVTSPDLITGGVYDGVADFSGSGELRGELALMKKQEDGSENVVFIAMHGAYGEDGTVQGFLDLLRVPYTGSGVLGSALAMDKERSSQLFEFHGLKVLKFLVFERKELGNIGGIAERVSREIGLPAVVKPVSGGSSLGVKIVRDEGDLGEAILEVFINDERIMVQKYVKGKELTCAVLDEGGASGPVALPPTEIRPKNADFFDYKAKYALHGSEEITPPHLPDEIISEIQKIAVKAHSILGCYGFSRTDMILDGETIYVLETNTIPGMTETSLYPQAARAAGIAFPDLLDRLVLAALRRGSNNSQF